MRIGVCFLGLCTCLCSPDPVGAQTLQEEIRQTRNVIVSRTGPVEARLKAVQRLADLNDAAASATNGLLEALLDPDEEVRVAAVRGLWPLAGVRQSIVAPELARVFRKDRSKKVRDAAAPTLGALGRHGAPYVPDLLAALDRPEEYDQQSIIVALGNIGPHARKATPAIAAILRDGRQADLMRQLSAAALGGIGFATAAAVPDLITVVKDPKQSIRLRCAAINSLGLIGAEAPQVIPTLVSFLDLRDHRQTVGAAINALGLMGRDASDAVPALIDFIMACRRAPDFQRDRNSAAHQGCKYAVGTLGAIGRESRPAMSLLVNMLFEKPEDDNPTARSNLSTVRWECVQALAQMGPGVKEFLPNLVQVVKTSDVAMPGDMGTVFAAMGEPGLQALLEVLGELPEDLVQRSAICNNVFRCISSFGPDAKKALPILRDFAQREPHESIKSDYAVLIESIRSR